MSFALCLSSGKKARNANKKKKEKKIGKKQKKYKEKKMAKDPGKMRFYEQMIINNNDGGQFWPALSQITSSYE